MRMFGGIKQSVLAAAPAYTAVIEDNSSTEAYEIETNEKTGPYYLSRRTPISSTRAQVAGVVSIVSVIVLSVSLVFLFGYHGLRLPAVGGTKAMLDCGSSIEEAQAKGCIFDVLNYSWVPSLCYDEETVIEFRQWLNQSELEFGAFPFFEDLAAQHRVAGENELAKRIGGEQGVLTYSTQQEHRAHCVFTMRRYARMQKNPEKRRIPIAVTHLEHCLKEVIEGLKGPLAWENGRLGSEFGVGFSTC